MAKLNCIGKLFPSMDEEIASYDPATFFINLGNISQSELADIAINLHNSKNLENLKTFVHEIRHYVDHIGTLWGQKNILNYLRALNARMNNDVKYFDSIVDYKIQDNQLFYDEYYTEEYSYSPVESMDKRWGWEPSVGLKFNAKGLPDETKPIPLIRFITHDKKPIIRIPLSIASLLETNSVSEEMKVHHSYIDSLSETEKPFHMKFFEEEMFQGLIYNQKNAVYSVAVHLTANLLNISDLSKAFRISSIISTFTLNIPHSIAVKIPIDEKYFKDGGDRSKLMLENHEYGFIFFALLANYKTHYLKTKKFDINEMLKSSNLPDYDEIEKLVTDEMESMENEIKLFNNFKELFLSKTSSGKGVVKFLGLGFEKKSFLDSVYKHKIIPTVICSDTEISLKKYTIEEIHNLKPIGRITSSDWYSIAWKLKEKLNELYDVRGV